MTTKTFKDTYFYALIIMLIGLAFFFNNPTEIIDGLIRINTHQSTLLSDYMAIGNIGSTFVNAAIMTLIGLMVIRLVNAKITGPLVAALFTICGFSFFGKNPINFLPILTGAYLYSKQQKIPFNNVLLVALFGSALGPLVSYFAFGISMPFYLNFVLAFMLGCLTGFLLPVLSNHFIAFHQGFNLYNIGFTAGILGMILISVYRMFGYNINPVSLVYDGNDLPLFMIMIGFCILLIIGGFILNKNLNSDLLKLFNASGRLVSDFILEYSLSATLINMGLTGLLSIFYIFLLGGKMTGPAIGGVFTIIGFAAFGKHVKNVFPIFLGVHLAMQINAFDGSTPSSIVSLLFATTLAPIPGHFGFIYGVLAGFLHIGVVSNVGILHGGVNLYNNGFSGGFVAGFLVPILNAFTQRKNKEV